MKGDSKHIASTYQGFLNQSLCFGVEDVIDATSLEF